MVLIFLFVAFRIVLSSQLEPGTVEAKKPGTADDKVIMTSNDS